MRAEPHGGIHGPAVPGRRQDDVGLAADGAEVAQRYWVPRLLMDGSGTLWLYGMHGLYRRVRDDDAWQETQAAWQDRLSQLVADFAAGHAAVKPVDNNVCRYCDFASLCRIDENVDT